MCIPQYVFARECSYLLKPQEGITSPEPGVTDGYAPLGMVLGSELNRWQWQ